jgi:hypothetical protein
VRRYIALLVAFVVVAAVSPLTADAFPSGGALPPVLTLDIAIAGLDGVPIDAAGVALNVTVTNPATAGFLTVYPCGAQRPTASNLNYVADQTVPNFVIAALSPDGDVCIDTMAVVDVVVDLAGYLPAGSPIVTLPEPKRIVDSRLSLGVPRRLAAGEVATVQVTGNAGVPSDASMVLVNTTAVDTGTPGFITVFPCGEAIPATSTLNFTANAIVPNFVLARIGSGGQVCVFTMSPTDLVMDVAGYVPAGVGEIVPLSAPARLLDTRDGIGGPASPIGPGGRALQVGGVGTIPLDASAVIVNLTATRAGLGGFVTAFPCGTPRPLASNVNFIPGGNVANMAIVKLDAAGQLCFTTNTDVDVIADVSAYLIGDTAITSVTPVRIYDSREGVDPQCNIGVRATSSTIEIVDLRTGAVTASVPLVVSSPRARVRADCQHIDVVGDAPPLYWRGWVLDRTGAILQSYQLDDFSGNVLFTSVGPLMVRQIPPVGHVAGPTTADVEDAITHDVLFSLPELSMSTDSGYRFWYPLGATDDTSLLAFRYDTVDRFHSIVSYWTIDGVPLGDVQLANGLFPTGLSPSGTYISYLHGTGLTAGDLVVATPDGVEVSRTHMMFTDLHPVWMSDGAIMLCQPDAHSVGEHQLRWDLFSPQRPFIPGDPFQSCLLDAR